MPAATAYRRAPLVDPVYVPLTDAAVNADGLIKLLTGRVLKMVNVDSMSALDSVLATKLGGYTQTPPVPDIEGAASQLMSSPVRFAETCRAAAMIASMNRDKDAMLRVLDALRAFAQAMPQMT